MRRQWGRSSLREPSCRGSHPARTGVVQAGGDLARALLLNAGEGESAATGAQVRSCAGDYVRGVGERRRASAAQAICDANEIDRVRAADRAANHVEARCGCACAAVGCAVGAVFERIALSIAAHGAWPAVRRARRARLGGLADAVAAARARAAILRAGKTSLARRSAHAVAAARAHAAIGGARCARLVTFASTVAAPRTEAAVLGTSEARLVVVADVVAAGSRRREDVWQPGLHGGRNIERDDVDG